MEWSDVEQVDPRFLIGTVISRDDRLKSFFVSGRWSFGISGGFNEVGVRLGALVRRARLPCDKGRGGQTLKDVNPLAQRVFLSERGRFSAVEETELIVIYERAREPFAIVVARGQRARAQFGDGRPERTDRVEIVQRSFFSVVKKDRARIREAIGE